MPLGKLLAVESPTTAPDHLKANTGTPPIMVIEICPLVPPLQVTLFLDLKTG